MSSKPEGMPQLEVGMPQPAVRLPEFLTCCKVPSASLKQVLKVEAGAPPSSGPPTTQLLVCSFPSRDNSLGSRAYWGWD